MAEKPTFYFDIKFTSIFGRRGPREIDKATDKVWRDHKFPSYDKWQDLWDDVAILASESLKDDM